jgi:hypothetical protein
MAETEIDPAGEIPEADLIEQQLDLDEPALPTEATASDDTSISDELVDEADLLEQKTRVTGADEDDYPHD